MDQQIPTGSENGARLEPVGENWASGVGPVKLGTRSSRFRWAIALGIVLCVALVTVGGAVVLSGAGGAAKSLTAGNAPKNTVMFVDLRMDLPGDQHQKLADFMSHFPGFKDRAQFDSAFDEILNKLTGSISPDLTYTWAFKAWTTGELSIAVTSLGANGGMTSADMNEIMQSISSGLGQSFEPTASLPTSEPNGVAIVALKDRAAGEKWVASEMTKAGVTFTAQDYAGTKLYVAQKATNGLTAAYAFTDKVLLFGTVDAVKAGLDAPAKGSLADDADYQAAMHSLSGDSVATFYMDPQALMGQAIGSMGSIYGMAGMPMTGMNLDASAMPAWMVGSVRAESDHMTVEMMMPKAKGALDLGNKQSVLASELPGSTVGVYELHSVGKLVNDELKAFSGLTAPASTKDAIGQIQDALAKVGGIDWIGDADMVLTKTGSSYSGGLVVKTPDAATATSKKAMITSLIALAGGSMGITSADETYKGTTITMVSMSTGGSSAPVRVGIATKGDLLVAGYEDSFVKAILDTTAADSLATKSDYKTVMAAVGTSNYQYGYFNVAAVADQVGQAFSANPGYYNLNYKPYVDHIGGIAFAQIDGNTVTLRLVFTAK
jgi:hypothetical protein